LLLEFFPVFLVAGETVEKIASVSVSLDSAFEQTHHQIGWDEFSLLYVALDGLSEFSSLFLLFSEEVPSGEMLELVVPHQVICLSSLATSGSSQEEEDVGFGEYSLTVAFGLCNLKVTGDCAQPMSFRLPIYNNNFLQQTQLHVMSGSISSGKPKTLSRLTLTPVEEYQSGSETAKIL
jgi:hypothetical protein